MRRRTKAVLTLAAMMSTVAYSPDRNADQGRHLQLPPGDAIVWTAGSSSNGTAASANPLVLQNG